MRPHAATDDGEDIWYISESQLTVVQEKLRKAQAISLDDILKLENVEHIPEDAVMIPVDLQGVVEIAVEQNPKAAAEIFIKARERFVDQHVETPTGKVVEVVIASEEEGLIVECRNPVLGEVVASKKKLAKDAPISELEDHINLQLGWQNVSCIDEITQVELTGRERLGNYQKIMAREVNPPKKGWIDCPQPMTAKEWRSYLENEDGDIDYAIEHGLLYFLREKRKRSSRLTRRRRKNNVRWTTLKGRR